MLVYAALPIENYRRMGHGMGQRISYKNRLTFSPTKRRKSPENDSFQEIFGAGNRTRTGTLFMARDFKSLVSTDFTMPAGYKI